MRHQRRRRTLGIVTAHRTAKLRNLLRALVLRKRIETTHAKAKETSAFAEKMITIAKRDGLHARRLLISKVRDPEIARILITQIAPLFKDRKGGYTRVLRMGYRAGDGAQVALLEWTAAFEAPVPRKRKPRSLRTRLLRRLRRRNLPKPRKRKRNPKLQNRPRKRTRRRRAVS